MAKGSRKRKASAVDAEALKCIAENDAQAEQRGSTEKLADDDLFVFDTEPDNAAVHIPGSGRKRPRASKEKKLTRAQAILAAATPGVPLGTGSAYAPRKRTPACSERLPSMAAVAATRKAAEVVVEEPTAKADAWQVSAPNESWVPDKPVVTRPSTLGRLNRPLIAAVEVDPAGCSFNPDYEQHQDAIAEAVAAEVAKQIERDLQPAAIPLTVSQADFDMAEMAIGLGGDDGDEDDEAEMDAGGDGVEAIARVQKKKTKKDRSRAERRRSQDAAVAEKKSLKAMRRDIDSAKKLVESIQSEEEEAAQRRARRQADEEEKLKTLPPKLGRHRWQAQRLQVLASDDVTGSLRTLRAFPMVAKDRFNSLQKRGVVQVTVQQHWTKPTARRVKQYEKGVVREKAMKGQEEVDALARGNRQKEKKKKIKK